MIERIKNVPARPDRALVLHRLGYRRGKTELDAAQMHGLDGAFRRCAGMIKADAAFLRLGIVSRGGGLVSLEGGAELPGKDIVKLLGGSGGVYLMGATVPGYDSLTKGLFGRDPEFAVVLDAYTSEYADAALDFVCALVSQRLRPFGEKLTRRFSPGYGDMPLDAQKGLFEALELSRLGVSVLESGLLRPEKSVIAVAGVIGRNAAGEGSRA